jgi:hypothetical protein
MEDLSIIPQSLDIKKLCRNIVKINFLSQAQLNTTSSFLLTQCNRCKSVRCNENKMFRSSSSVSNPIEVLFTSHSTLWTFPPIGDRCLLSATNEIIFKWTRSILLFHTRGSSG